MNLKFFIKLLIAPALGVIIMLIPMIMFIRAVSAPDLVTAQAPGITPFEVTEADSYTVWRLSAGVMGDNEFRVESDELPAGLAIHIRRSDDGTTVPLQESMGSTQSSSGSPTKISLAKAQLSPGKYELVGTTSGETVGLTVSKSVGSLQGFATGMMLLFLGILVLAGGVIYAVIAILRKVTSSSSQTSAS